MTASTDPEVNRRLKAIADPSRQAILKEAKRSPGISCGELVERLGLSQPTVSHHLKELEETGLTDIKRKGNRLLVYCHGPALIALAAEIISTFVPPV